MRFDTLCRCAAAAGAASITAAAAAGTYPAEVTVPLGSSCPPYAYGSGYGDVSGAGIVSTHSGVAWHNTPQIPGRFPVERVPVQYMRYYPDVWYGLPGSTLPVVAPQIHTPTDTTQLGFYYQRVPTWLPVPGMVPPPPIPSQLHSFPPQAFGVPGDGTVTNERVISVRRVDGTPTTPGHTASGQTVTDPGVVPPAPADRLPLSPPPAPTAEPNAFVPPTAPGELPQIQPLFPASLND